MTAGRYTFPLSGLVAGPLAWALTFQLNYTLTGWQCANKIYPAPWISATGAGLALLGALVSYLSLGSPQSGDLPRTRRFVAGISIGAGVLFALVMLVQASAGLVFDGCER